MTNAPSTGTSDQSLTRDVLYAIRYYPGGPRTLIVLAVVLVLGGVALNWGWLVAAGLAPILIALLPCAAMCALGMCMAHHGQAEHNRNTAGSTQVRAADKVNSHDRVGETSELVDPVSQRMLPAATAIASVHQGRIYYFEDRANRDAFETDPEKYLAASQAIGLPIAAPDKSSEHSHQVHGCC
jgi:YHS domain-containing protein